MAALMTVIVFSQLILRPACSAITLWFLSRIGGNLPETGLPIKSGFAPGKPHFRASAPPFSP
jgi:hypothetical protein